MIIFSKRLNSSICPIDGTLTGTSTPGHSGPGNNGSEEELHQMQFSVISGTLIGWRILSLNRGVFYSPIRSSQIESRRQFNVSSFFNEIKSDRSFQVSENCNLLY